MNQPDASTRLTPSGRLGEAQLANILGYQLAQATIVTDQVFDQAVGTPLALRPVEFTVLSLVHENPGGTMSQLAKALAVTAPHITAIVDRLVERKLLVRQPSAQDRRAQSLITTAQGSKLARLAAQNIMAQEALLPLTLGERTLLAEILHKMACARGASPGAQRAG